MSQLPPCPRPRQTTEAAICRRRAACLPVVLATILLTLAPRVGGAGPADLDVIIGQFRQSYLGDPAHPSSAPRSAMLPATPTRANAGNDAATLRDDGSWADINYTLAARSSWPAYGHLSRIHALVTAARTAGTAPAEAARYLTAAHRALGYWMGHDFQCPNWWYNDMGVPKVLGLTALLLGDELQPAERKYLTTVVLPRSKMGTMTGQNRIWVTGNALVLALLQRDEKQAAKAAGIIAAEVRVTGEEGIQPDESFHQHGPQLQFGNYGLSFAGEISQWALLLRGTALALPPEKLTILRQYLLEGQSWVYWQGAMDISALGRQITPHAQQARYAGLEQVMRTMAVLDGTHAEEYAAFGKRNGSGAANDLLGDRYFWRSDYLVHRRPEFCATLKMFSRRVARTETGMNGENLSGDHLADGTLLVYRRGTEYQATAPARRGERLPATYFRCGSSTPRPPRPATPITFSRRRQPARPASPFWPTPRTCRRCAWATT